jgi:hypothetical protein
MSYYPILQAPDCEGWVTLCNFAPNNWEHVRNVRRYANLSWTDGKIWRHKKLSEIEPNGLQRFCSSEISGFVPEGVAAFFSLSQVQLPEKSSTLPSTGDSKTTYPFWRATLGLLSKAGSETAYQGEIDPFPPLGSLLTFGHFLQCQHDIQNYLLFVNLETLPNRREGEIEIRKADAPAELLSSSRVTNNAITCIPLDGIGLTDFDLPLIMCRQLSGIPLYLSITKDGRFMSLEHTHPPASAVVHGQRWLAQKHLKQFWFNRASE